MFDNCSHIVDYIDILQVEQRSSTTQIRLPMEMLLLTSVFNSHFVIIPYSNLFALVLLRSFYFWDCKNITLIIQKKQCSLVNFRIGMKGIHRIINMYC